MRRGLFVLILALSVMTITAGCGGNSEPGTITGALTYAGTATAPADVSISLAPSAGTVAYADGVYTIGNVPRGNYVITIETEDYAAVSVAVTVAPGGTTTKDIEFVSNTGLLAYYPFDGNADDASGFDKDGTVTGAVLTADRFGRAESAYEFDGVDDYISIPALWDNPEALTFMAWVRPNNPGPSQCIFSHQDGGWLVLMLALSYYAADVTLDFPLDGNLMDYLFTVVAYDSASISWQHVAVVWSRGQFLKLYINGVLADTENLDGVSTGANGLYDNNCGSTIGTDNCGNYDFTGCIDEIRAYGRALSDAEIAALAQR